jgi:endonuclease YncB( thermonuclease family)
MGEAAHRTLLAFIRKQNLILETLDGQRAGVDLEPRQPVHVFLSGTQVNRKLLSSGLAFYDASTAGSYADLYQEAEQQAKSRNEALWDMKKP